MNSPAGMLATVYAIRLCLGFYRMITVTKTYQWHLSEDESLASEILVSSLKAALAEAIVKLPALQFSITHHPEQSVEASFKRHTVIPLQELLRFSEAELETVPSASPQKQYQLHDHSLALELQRIHCGWLHSVEDKLPSWRTFALRHDGPWTRPITSSTKVDIIFAFHHGLADGLSGLSFQRCLTQSWLRHLELQGISEPPVSVEDEREVSPPVLTENAVTYDGEPKPKDVLASIRLDTFSSVLSNLSSLGTASQHQASDFVRIRILQIPEHDLKQALQACRKHSITLTGFLHTVIVGFLALHIEPQINLVGITPISIRKRTGASNDDLVNHVSYSETTYSTSLLERIRRYADPSISQRLDLMKQITAEFSAAHRSEVNNSGPPRLLVSAASVCSSLLNLISPLSPDSATKTPNPPPTYELSNMGMEAVDLPPPPSPLPPPSSKDHEITPQSISKARTSMQTEKITFAQVDTGPTSLLGINCVSYGPGPLVITVTWQKGQAQLEGVADGLVAALAERFARVGELLEC